MMTNERFLRRALILLAFAALIAGLFASFKGLDVIAGWIWAAGTAPVIAALGISIARDLATGRIGVDAVALLGMTAALVLNANLAAVVVAVMYAGGTVLEDFAVARAQRDLKSLADRAPRTAHRRQDNSVEDIPVDAVRHSDIVLVRVGEIVPIDGVLLSPSAALDESALTGEPLPAVHGAGDGLRSGAVNASETFEMQATATAGESTYAGIVRLVTAAQTAKAPFIRMADKYALLLLPITIVVAGAAWLASGDALRGLAVLVASTPCPLILAAPVAFIAGVSRAARHGILIKGGGHNGAPRDSQWTHLPICFGHGRITQGYVRAWPQREKALLVQALEENARLKAENAELREEIARLKGLKGRPSSSPAAWRKGRRLGRQADKAHHR